MFEQMMEQVRGPVSETGPQLLFALGILVAGWLIAMLLSLVVRLLLRKTTLDNRLASLLCGEQQGKTIPVEEWAGRIVFYGVMIFVLVAFFQKLGLTLITEPLNVLLKKVFEFIPNLGAAVLLLLLAWVIASVLRMVVGRGLSVAKLDERLSKGTGVPEEKTVSVSKPIAEAVYWVTFAFFLPAILDALKLEGPLGPVKEMFSKILGFLPNLLGAALILLVGWFIARILQRIVSNLLAAAGTDKLSERLGLTGVLGKHTLSGLIGLVVYVLVFIPVLVAALNALELEAITKPASAMLEKILSAIPLVFGATLVLIVAYVAARIVSGLIVNLLKGVGFDKLPARLGLASESEAGTGKSLSEVAGYLVMVAILLMASIEAAGLMGFDQLAALVSRFLVFAGHLITGLVIFAVGLFLANVVAKTIQAGKHAQAMLLATLARVAIIVLAAAMALSQMDIADNIVNLAFGLTLGAIAVAVALAFGLGGREAAGEVLAQWRDKLKSTK